MKKRKAAIFLIGMVNDTLFSGMFKEKQAPDRRKNFRQRRNRLKRTKKP